MIPSVSYLGFLIPHFALSISHYSMSFPPPEALLPIK